MLEVGEIGFAALGGDLVAVVAAPWTIVADADHEVVEAHFGTELGRKPRQPVGATAGTSSAGKAHDDPWIARETVRFHPSCSWFVHLGVNEMICGKTGQPRVCPLNVRPRDSFR